MTVTIDNIADMRVIDLTLTLDERLKEAVVPWVPGITFTPVATIEETGRSVHRVVMANHCGTHIDAQTHFIKGGITIDNVPFSQLIGEAIMLDLTYKKADEEITVDDLEKAGSDVKEGDIVILHTGWDRWWGNRDKYFFHSPYLATDASQWLVEHKIATLGFDIPCPDNMNNLKPGDLPPNHMILLSNNIILIEMLCNLGSVDRRRFPFIVLPLKYKAMDGAAARAIALLP